MPARRFRSSSLAITGRPERFASSPASVDLPLAAGPHTISASGPRARQRSRSASARNRSASPRRAGSPLGEAAITATFARTSAQWPHERQQRGLARRPSRPAILIRQQTRGARLTVRLEVHREEGEVGADIEPAQPRVELDPVDDLHAVFEQHVLAAQIAVSVAYVAAARALVELRRVRCDEGVRELAHEVQPPVRGVDDRFELVQVALPALERLRGLCALGDRRALVEAREHAGGPAYVPLAQLAGIDPALQRAGLLEAAHLHGVLERARIALLGECEARRRAHERADAEIDPGGQLAVDLDLRVTRRAT